MKISWKLAWGATALTAAGIWMSPDEAMSQSAPPPAAKKPQAAVNSRDGSVSDNTMLKIPANANFPINRQINMGGGRSMMIQFPMELRDVMVSDPDKVDVVLQTSDRVFVVAKKPGSANVFFFDTQGNQIATLELNVGSDLTSLDALLKKLIPGSAIKSELAGASIVLTGSVRNPIDSTRAMEIATQYAEANKGSIGAASATTTRTEIGGVTTWQTQFQGDSAKSMYKNVINMLAIEGEEQVMLKVTVAEVNRTVLKQLGVNFGASQTAGNFFNSAGTMNAFPITASTLGQMNNSGIVTGGAPTGTPGCNSILPQIHTNYVGQSGYSGSYGAGGMCLAYTLKALEREGLVRTLAEPTLTAVSGESAKFLVGGEYPVPVSYASGTLGVEFKEYGVGVAFTPVVMSEGRISLKIDTQVSELSSDGALTVGGVQLPSLRKRSALSTVELPSGGSLAMAGLISDSTRQNIEGLPGLKDVPILGTLFRSRDYQQFETELVVIVTPYMVRPTSRQNLARPDDGLAPASDLKANLLGHLNRVYGKGKPQPDGGLKGSHGFIVD